MKYLGLLPIAALCMCLTGCMSEKEKWAQKAIDRYVVFVDSVNDAKFKNRIQRWDYIEQEHTRKRNEAQAALEVLPASDREKEQKRISERDEKYGGVKASVEGS